MAQARRNLYKLDDLLLKMGWIGLPLVLLAVACIILVVLNARGPDDPPIGLQGELAYVPALLALIACPVALIVSGFALRRREKKIAAVWDLLRLNGELNVADLTANSDFALVDLERAIRFLNNNGLGHYVWDRSEGTIQDGRLRTMQLHVEKCEVCAASVSIEVPLGFHEVPECPFCGNPVAIETLEARRRAVFKELRAEHRPTPAQAKTSDGLEIPFSIPIFLGLGLFFWPAALAYAFFKYHEAR